MTSVNYTITVDNTSSADSPNLVCTVTDTLLGINQAGRLWPGTRPTRNQRHLHGAAGRSRPAGQHGHGDVLADGLPEHTDRQRRPQRCNLFQPSVTIDKTGDTLSKVGDVVNYTITVDNTSSADTPNLVCTVTDALLGLNQPVNLAWNAANYVINVTYTVPAGDPDPLVNTATVTLLAGGLPEHPDRQRRPPSNLFQPSIQSTRPATR